MCTAYTKLFYLVILIAQEGKYCQAQFTDKAKKFKELDQVYTTSKD